MTADKKIPDERGSDITGMVRSLREEAEAKLAKTPPDTSALDGEPAEKLIHELRVHQIELETQAEELRRVQNELVDSRDKYLDLFDFAPVGYLTLSNEALIEDVNLTGATFLGVERSRLVRARFRKVVAPEFLEPWDRYFLNVLKGAARQSCPLVLVRADGGTFPARLECARIIDPETGRITVRVILSDITYIRQAEDALRIANKKLNLLSGITRHDINNDLLTLNGFLELLHEKIKDPALEQFFSRIADASNRIFVTIRFTKEYEQIGVKAPVWQDCRTLIDTAAEQIPAGKVVVKNDIPAGFLVFADPLVVRVYSILMDNAVRHGGKITTIRFSVENHNGNPVVIYDDDGDGIPATDKERIFDRGYGKNTGFGLTLAREILDITGITILETGVFGTGARFNLTIPKGAYRGVSDLR